jgi:hypothetical protein
MKLPPPPPKDAPKCPPSPRGAPLPPGVPLSASPLHHVRGMTLEVTSPLSASLIVMSQNLHKRISAPPPPPRHACNSISLRCSSRMLSKMGIFRSDSALILTLDSVHVHVHIFEKWQVLSILFMTIINSLVPVFCLKLFLLNNVFSRISYDKKLLLRIRKVLIQSRVPPGQ